MTMFTRELHELAQETLTLFRTHNVLLVTAESCTGGLIAGLLSEIPGSSDVLDRGFVTYSYDSKTDLLGVPAELIRMDGAVAADVAVAMVRGALEKAPKAGVAVAVTGVAGPGQSERKPAGLVYVSAGRRGQEPRVEECRFAGDRTTVRLETIRRALTMAQAVLEH